MMLTIFFSIQLVIIGLINLPWIVYYDENEVKDMKDDMQYFASSHQNPDSGLFIEPDIDSNYRAINSINFSSSVISSTELINPRDNDNLDKDMKDFFQYYLFEKQNDNGSYSDIMGLGNIISTYQVIDTIDKIDYSFIGEHSNDYDENKISLIIQYLTNSLYYNGYGFIFNEYSPLPDIISTYCGISIAKRFNVNSILNNDNLTRYVNSTLSEFNLTPELTYYGIKAYLALGLEFNSTQKALINLYFQTYYNYLDGGYSSTPSGLSDVQSTYYALSSLYSLNITPTDALKTLYYVLNCSKTDGGFGYSLNNVTLSIYYNSDFISGWAAMNSIELIENNITITSININSYRKAYYDWLYNHQGENGLFGDISLQANYWGVLSIYHANSEDFTEEIDIDEIWDYVEECYNKKDGGFGHIPNVDSSLYSTYCAVQLYEMFYKYEEIELPEINETIDYLSDLQNSDGGCSLGLNLYELLDFFGPLRENLLSILKTNISTTESTYWVVSSLKILDGIISLDSEDLMHWISSCQNADGGFSVVLGFYSDSISTYCGLEIFRLMNSEPMSKIAAMEFLKNAQNDEGSFDPLPALALFFEFPSTFLITYHACIGLYDYEYQPEEIKDLIDWYEDCLSSNTGGIGDKPNFGGDLRNTPFGIILLEELKYDQDFNPRPWTELITAILFFEILLILFFGLLKIITFFNATVAEFIKTKIGYEDKRNPSYLKKFSAIYCENLNVYAGGKLIVDSVSLRIQHGEILGVLGESGAGKSTFVKALLGMRKYTGVSEIYGMDSKKNARKLRPIYGYVPQDLGKIYPDFTTLQNIMYFGRQYGLAEKEIKIKARRLLKSLEIEDKANEFVKNLSGGQKRRVSIAIALVHNPIFCILDEPTSGLDPVVRENLWLTLTKINEQFNTTLIVITHYPEESRFCHKVCIFGRGRGMIDFGRPKDLLAILPGKGRKIELFFNDVQENAIKKLEAIEGIEMALENKAGTDFVLFTDLNMNTVYDKIREKFPKAIPQILQSDSKMEEFFRIKAIKVPEIE
ncbi:MAG: ATP-binding cassette domain-containing protein [Candidatus Hermodarchaeota archaeon]